MESNSKSNQTKIKVVFFVGYNGIGFCGNQVQNKQDVRTVEQSLFEGLFAAGVVDIQSEKDFKKIGWSRGARTDKGVHALANTMDFFMTVPQQFLNGNAEEQDINQEDESPQPATDTDVPQGLQNEEIKEEPSSQDKLNKSKKYQQKQKVNFKGIINMINSNIPQEIRVFSIKRILNNFDSKMCCKDRLYEYIMPLRIFLQYEDFKSDREIPPSEEEEILKRINNIVSKFQGTHNFHNYTLDQSPKDPTCQRYIIDIQATLVDNQDLPIKFVQISINGQSFIYHQIRKMIGTVCQIFQNNYSDKYVDNTFFKNHIPLWLAPAEGLFLNKMNFTSYNSQREIPQPLLFDEQEKYDIEQFKVYIEDIIYNSEIKNQVFTRWLEEMMDPKSQSQADDYKEQNYQEDG